MELFKFETVAPFSGGVAIDNVDSKLWIERYREAGEFELQAKLSSGLRELLPLGSFISHVDTKEVMLVEDHYIEEALGEDSVITVTGRSLDAALLEQRIVGEGLANDFPTPPFTEYLLSVATLGSQVRTLIRDHITLAITASTFPNIAVVDNSTSTSQPARVIKRTEVSKAVQELLAIENLGMKTKRRTDGFIDFEIHEGVDHSNDISFSWKAGELESAEYFQSLRDLKNAAHVKGRYVEELVYTTGKEQYDRRAILVDGSDLDDYLDTTPSGATLTSIRTKMATRGEEAFSVHQGMNIARTDISRSTRYFYRGSHPNGYDIGDIVSVDGNYGTIEKRRVVEFTEIEDDTGESSHPTLAIL